MHQPVAGGRIALAGGRPRHAAVGRALVVDLAAGGAVEVGVDHVHHAVRRVGGNPLLVENGAARVDEARRARRAPHDRAAAEGGGHHANAVEDGNAAHQGVEQRAVVEGVGLLVDRHHRIAHPHPVAAARGNAEVGERLSAIGRVADALDVLRALVEALPVVPGDQDVVAVCRDRGLGLAGARVVGRLVVDPDVRLERIERRDRGGRGAEQHRRARVGLGGRQLGARVTRGLALDLRTLVAVLVLAESAPPGLRLRTGEFGARAGQHGAALGVLDGGQGGIIGEDAARQWRFRRHRQHGEREQAARERGRESRTSRHGIIPERCGVSSRSDGMRPPVTRLRAC